MVTLYAIIWYVQPVILLLIATYLFVATHILKNALFSIQPVTLGSITAVVTVEAGLNKSTHTHTHAHTHARTHTHIMYLSSHIVIDPCDL